VVALLVAFVVRAARTHRPLVPRHLPLAGAGSPRGRRRRRPSRRWGTGEPATLVRAMTALGLPEQVSGSLLDLAELPSR
jgi:hypothetical protein